MWSVSPLQDTLMFVAVALVRGTAKVHRMKPAGARRGCSNTGHRDKTHVVLVSYATGFTYDLALEDATGLLCESEPVTVTRPASSNSVISGCSLVLRQGLGISRLFHGCQPEAPRSHMHDNGDTSLVGVYNRHKGAEVGNVLWSASIRMLKHFQIRGVNSFLFFTRCFRLLFRNVILL